MSRITQEQLIADFIKLGVRPGDTILIRASLGSVGRLSGGANSFIDALLDSVGTEGTIVSLAFTGGSFIRRPREDDAFTRDKKSYAGALPNAMLARKDSYRSQHPMCSFVAIGKNANLITKDHDAMSPAYEPVRKIIQLDGKCVLVGCVGSSPGFTTTHLAEADLGYLKSIPIFPWLKSTYYKDSAGVLKLFRRKDPGLCSASFYKFYSYYVKGQILMTEYIGKAYSVLAPAKECYRIDLDILRNDKKFNVCGSKDCFTCNAGRWDRIHYAPIYLLRQVYRKLGGVIARDSD